MYLQYLSGNFLGSLFNESQKLTSPDIQQKQTCRNPARSPSEISAENFDVHFEQLATWSPRNPSFNACCEKSCALNSSAQDFELLESFGE